MVKRKKDELVSFFKIHGKIIFAWIVKAILNKAMSKFLDYFF